MAAELFDALACSYVPEASRPVYASRQAVVSSEVELAAREFCRVALQREEALTSADVPNFRSIVER